MRNQAADRKRKRDDEVDELDEDPELPKPTRRNPKRRPAKKPASSDEELDVSV